MSLSALTASILLACASLAFAIRPCAYEECVCNTLKIDCSGRGLTSLPKAIAGHFSETILDISNTNITAIPSGALPADLNSFYARHTPLSRIDDDAFATSATTLTGIIIQDTKLTEIPRAFSQLPKLRSLSWYGPARWPTSVRTALGRSVNRLTLNGVGMTSLPDWIYTDFPLLSSLSFINNRMPTLKFNSPKTVFDGISFLHLDNNRIQNIDSFLFPSSLKMLYLLSNNIQKVSSMQFSHGTSELTYLNFRHNPLKEIASNAFEKLTKLTTLYLDSTQLSRLPLALRSLPALGQLYLHDIPALVCSCEQAGLVSWFKTRSDSLTISAGSQCQSTDVRYFLSNLAMQCPSR